MLLLMCGASIASGQAEGHNKGTTRAVVLEHAAYDHRDVPSAVVHVPAHFDPAGPLQLVIFLHGYSGCAPVLMSEGPVVCRPGRPPHEGWALSRYHDAAGSNTIFVIPQLALLARDGRPGCFGRTGCFRSFLQELLKGPLANALGGVRTLSQVDGIGLVAHSAGFQTALAIVEQGQVGELIRHVVLFDALYAGTEGFARWMRSRPEVKLVSIHLGRGKTRRNSERLHRTLSRVLSKQEVARVGEDELVARVADRRLVVAHGRGPHARVPQRYLSELLRVLWPGVGASR